jgi:hypothetical protein
MRNPKRVRLALPAVSNLARLPGERPADAAGTIEATDPACHADWDHQSRATSLLLYTHPDGATGACTGTLVAGDDPATDIPYVLTAQHCSQHGCARPRRRATGCCALRPATARSAPAKASLVARMCST